MAYCRSGRVGAIHSEANLDRGRVAALGRAKAHFTGPRRRQVLIYLGVAAIIALTSADAFSNPAHKPVAPHQNKTVKAETGKRRAVTDASLRNKAALEDDDE